MDFNLRHALWYYNLSFKKCIFYCLTFHCHNWDRITTLATVIQFCHRCEERKYLKLCKKCTQYLCSDCKRDHILCEVSSGRSTLYSSSEHLIKETSHINVGPILKKPFCFTCTNQLCEDCLDTVQTEHNGHVIYKIENATKEIRNKAEKKFLLLRNKLIKLENKSMNLTNIGLALQKNVTAIEKYLILNLI